MTSAVVFLHRHSYPTEGVAYERTQTIKVDCKYLGMVIYNINEHNQKNIKIMLLWLKCIKIHLRDI